MNNRGKKVTMSVVGLVAVLVGVAASLGGSQAQILQQSNQSQIPESVNITLPSTQEELVETRELAVQAALSNPEVKSIIDRAFNYAVEHHLFANTVTIKTWDGMDVKPVGGDFVNGYTESYSGGTIIEVSVDAVANSVQDVKTSARNATDVTVQFTDNQKRAIEVSLADPKVKDLVADKEYYVNMVRDYGGVSEGLFDCKGDDFAIVQFSLVTGNGGMSTTVNTKTGAVHNVNVGSGWGQSP